MLKSFKMNIKKRKAFWEKYYEAKRLSSKEFYKKRFYFIEMAIISLMVVTFLSILDLLFYNLPKSYETQYIRTYSTLFLFVGTVLFYRYFLYKEKNLR